MEAVAVERMNRAFLDSGGNVSQLATSPFIPRKAKEATGGTSGMSHGLPLGVR